LKVATETELIVRAITEGFDKVIEEIEGAGDAAEEAGDDAGNSGTRWTELKSKLDLAKNAFQAVAGAAQVAIDQIKRGGEVQQVASTFDSLTKSIGTTADVMLGALQVATQGMVSNFDLMTSANRFMAMGLAATTEEAADLAEVAVTLGAAMNVGPNQAMEDFALLLANQSIPRLDTFGLSSGKVRERINELTSGINGLDRETAFLQATMEAAEETMIAVGGAAKGTAKDISTLEADVQNLKDEFALTTAEVGGPLISSMANARKSVRELDAAQKAAGVTNKELRAIRALVREESDKSLSTLETQARLTEFLNEMVEDQNLLLNENADTYERSDQILKGLVGTNQDLADSTEDVSEEFERSTELADMYAKAGEKNTEVSDRLTNSLRFQKEQLEEAAKTLRDDYLDAFNEALPLADDYIQAQDDMAAAQGEWVESTRDNSSEIATITAQLFGDLDADQKASMRDIVDTAEEGGAEWLGAFNTLQGDLSQSQREALVLRRAELEASQGDIASVYTGDLEAFKAAQAAKLEAEMAFTEQLKNNAFDIAEARIIAEGGDVEGNTAQLLDLAVALGLKTQEQADIQLEQTRRTVQTTEVTQKLFDIYLSDGVVSQEESERLANAVGLIGTGADLTTEQLVALGVAGTENAGMVTTAMELTDKSIIVASGSVDILATKLAQLPSEVEVNVIVNTIGDVPGGGGSGTTSTVMEEAGVN
jgi:hypothetical protein